MKTVRYLEPVGYLALSLALLASPAFAAPPEIRAVGNHLENKATGALVRLSGVNLPSLQWGSGENLSGSMTRILGTWKANAVRLNIDQARWLAGGTYQTTVDAMVNQASAAGAYIIIDNHAYVQPDNNAIAFWTSVAGRPLYKNNPAVLFGLINEPHDTTWPVWKDGDANGPGLQAVLNAVRATGANNLVVVGGLKWASDLSGVLTGGYALTDTSSGNGILYDMHLYPWHGWTGLAAAARTLPILLGEIGHDGGDTGATGKMFGGSSPMVYWQLLNIADAMNLSFTAYSFHPTGGPALITEWNNNYTPESRAGQFVLKHIASLHDTASESKVLNPGFETPSTNQFVYRPTGATWAFSGNAGIQKTWNTTPTGAQTAFLQTAEASDTGENGVDGAMTQTIHFDTVGTYAISFLLAQRSGKAALPIEVSVDDIPISSVAYTPTDALGDNAFCPVTTAPFTINTPGSHTIKLQAVASPGVGKEALIDQVFVSATAPAWIRYPGFILPHLNNGQFQYRPTNADWTFVGNAGVERNALGATTAPEGRNPNTAFLQTAAASDTGENNIDGSITRDIEFAAQGAYAIRFKAASRSGKGNLAIRVLVDGALVGTLTPTSTTWATFTTPAFNIYAPGFHTVQFAATPSATADNEAFIDDVSIVVPQTSFTRALPLEIGNAGFETPSGSSGYLRPTGTPWTFTGESKIASDLNGYKNYDGRHAPEGWQFAGFGSDGVVPSEISQSVYFPGAGTYALSFHAQRGRNGSQPLTIRIDGNVVGTHTPTKLGFYPYTTAPFAVTAGYHTVKVTGGLVTGTGKFSLVDAVNIWPVSVDQCSTTDFVTGQSLGNLRNDVTKWLGMKITVGASPLTVKELGRWVVSGNSGTHTVKIVNATGTTLGSVSVATSGAPTGFKYTSLATPVTLSANTSYFIVSQETNGGDQWHDFIGTTLSTTSAAVINSAANSATGTTFGLNGTTGSCFGPVDFKY